MPPPARRRVRRPASRQAARTARRSSVTPSGRRRRSQNSGSRGLGSRSDSAESSCAWSAFRAVVLTVRSRSKRGPVLVVGGAAPGSGDHGRSPSPVQGRAPALPPVRTPAATRSQAARQAGICARRGCVPSSDSDLETTVIALSTAASRSAVTRWALLSRVRASPAFAVSVSAALTALPCASISAAAFSAVVTRSLVDLESRSDPGPVLLPLAKQRLV